MKDYEKKIKLEKEISWAEYKFENYNSRVEVAKKNLEDTVIYHRKIEQELKRNLEEYENEKATFYDILKFKKRELYNWERRKGPVVNKPEPLPVPPPEPEPEPEPIIEVPIPIPAPDIAPIETTIEERREAAQDFREVADQLNGETDEIEVLTTQHKDWMARYGEDEGGHAIWQGRITKGFRIWLEANNLKILGD